MNTEKKVQKDSKEGKEEKLLDLKAESGEEKKKNSIVSLPIRVTLLKVPH